MAWPVLISILTAILVVAVAAPLPARIGEASERPIRDDTCRASVETKSRLNTGIAETPISLRCIEENIVSKSKQKEQVNLEIAKEMYSCWYKYGEGKADWYSGWDAWETDLHCKICSYVQFPDVKEAPTYGELNNYLNNKKIPGNDLTFADFFTGEENSIIQFGGPGVTPETKIDLSKSLYVVYTVAKFDEDKVEQLNEIYSNYEGGAEFGQKGINDQASVTVDADVGIGTGTVIGSAALGIFIGSNPIGWAVGIIGAVGGAGYALFNHLDADIPYYSLALFTTDDIAGVCDDFD